MARLTIIGSGGWIGQSVRALADQNPSRFDTLTISIREPFGNAHDLQSILRPGPDLTVICVAGLKSGDRADLYQVNHRLPALLVEALIESDAHLVHIGSAAEYGDPGSAQRIGEGFAPAPTSDYGASKLAGTEAVLRYPESCVLRAFNIADRTMPEGHVLNEIRDKVETACKTGSSVDLQSATTTRDFVSREFVAKSLLHAADVRTLGLFNLCSGMGTSYGQIVEAMGRILGCKLSLHDLAMPGIASVVGDPSAWLRVSGLSECMPATDLARLVLGK